MVMKEPLEGMQQMLAACVQALKPYVGEEGWQVSGDAPDERWQRLFGKESVVGVLAKLVAMHKSLAEQIASEQEAQQEVSHAPLSEAEWHLLALCVRRHFEEQG